MGVLGVRYVRVVDRPSYEELAALVASQAVLIDQLRAEVAVLRAENVELRRRLGMDSSNSSRPPSMDGYRKPAPKSLRKATGRKPGRAKGDPGGQLEFSSSPDEVVDHWPPACAGCGTGLDGASGLGFVRRQVVDLPQVRPVVTEHRIHKVACGCGRVNAGAAPGGIAGPVSYGPRARAVIAYLSVFGTLPADRLAQVMGSLFALPVSTGTVSSVLDRGYGALEGFEENVKAQLMAASVVHADETGVRVAGKLHWLHVACTRYLTWYGVHTRRGRAAIDDLGVLPGVTGVLVTDAYASYEIYGTKRALCGAHMLRELTAASEDTDRDQTWAKAMTGVLIDAKTACDTARDNGERRLDPALLTDLENRYHHAVLCGQATNPTGKTRALIKRLRDRAPEYQRHWNDPAVPFDNNQAERDLRMVKAQQKISGCWRTLKGAKRYARIRSYISTAAKHGHDRLTALTDLYNGQPWTIPAS